MSTKPSADMDVDPTASIDVKVPPKSGPKQKKEKRFARSQAFREKKGNEFVAANRRRLDAELCADYDGFQNYLVKRPPPPPTVHPTIVPITTRGIVSLMVNCAKQASEQMTLAYDAPIHALHRVTLAQIEAKLKKANHVQVSENGCEVTEQLLPKITRRQMSSEFEYDVEGLPRNFSPVAAAITGIGNFTSNGVDYHPRLEKGELVLSNLRKSVESFGVPDYDSNGVIIRKPTAARRTTAKSKCCIPGAEWALGSFPVTNPANPRLGAWSCWYITNIDHIIRHDYDANRLQADVLTVGRFIEKVAKKYPKLSGMIEFSPTGTRGQLLTLERREWNFDSFSLFNYVFPSVDEKCWSREELNAHEVYLGLLMMVGETPNPTVTWKPHQYIRHPSQCPYRYAARYSALVMSLTG